MEKIAGGLFSRVSFDSGNEMLTTGIALILSVGDAELREKSARLLHPEEIAIGQAYASDIRRRSYLHGRIAGKMAIGLVFPDLPGIECVIKTAVFGDPVLSGISLPYGISIAHSDEWNAGLCFPLTFPMGIDVEKTASKNFHVISSILSNKEKEICSGASDPNDQVHLLWTAKEAAGKAIRLGFRIPQEWYEIESIETVMNAPVNISFCKFILLKNLRTISCPIPGAILSIAYPADKIPDEIMIRLLS